MADRWRRSGSHRHADNRQMWSSYAGALNPFATLSFFKGMNTNYCDQDQHVPSQTTYSVHNVFLSPEKKSPAPVHSPHSRVWATEDQVDVTMMKPLFSFFSVPVERAIGVKDEELPKKVIAARSYRSMLVGNESLSSQRERSSSASPVRASATAVRQLSRVRASSLSPIPSRKDRKKSPKPKRSCSRSRSPPCRLKSWFDQTLNEVNPVEADTRRRHRSTLEEQQTRTTRSSTVSPVRSGRRQQGSPQVDTDDAGQSNESPTASMRRSLQNQRNCLGSRSFSTSPNARINSNSILFKCSVTGSVYPLLVFPGRQDSICEHARAHTVVLNAGRHNLKHDIESNQKSDPSDPLRTCVMDMKMFCENFFHMDRTCDAEIWARGCLVDSPEECERQPNVIIARLQRQCQGLWMDIQSGTRMYSCCNHQLFGTKSLHKQCAHPEIFLQRDRNLLELISSLKPLRMDPARPDEGIIRLVLYQRYQPCHDSRTWKTLGLEASDVSCSRELVQFSKEHLAPVKLHIKVASLHRAHWRFRTKEQEDQFGPRAKNARNGLKLLNDSPDILISSFTKEDWKFLLRFCNEKVQNNFLAPPRFSCVSAKIRRQRHRMDNYFQATLRKIFNDKIETVTQPEQTTSQKTP